jgi:hypothetical protein
MPRDRRRSPRIEILGRLHGHIASLDVNVTVLEMSLGGLSMETDFSFPIDAIHEFRLTLGDGTSVTLQGRVRYCRAKTKPDGAQVFITGVQFIDDEPTTDSPVGDIVQRLS